MPARRVQRDSRHELAIARRIRVQLSCRDHGHRQPPSQPTPSCKRPPGISSRWSTARARTARERSWREALERSQAFAARYAGKLAELDSAGLEQAMRELGAIQELVGRAGTYAGLRFSVDTADPAAGALMQEVQERGTEIETTLLFFELEWAALDDERAERAAR